MRQKVPHLTNIRTSVPRDDGKYSVRDEWPKLSRLWKHRVGSLIETHATTGEVYVESYPPGERPTTERYGAGQSFTQRPGVVYVIGSIDGATTESVSDDPIPLEVILEPIEAE